MVDDMESLEKQIQMLKKELIFTAKAFGINSNETICCSQKLDQLIIIHQKHGVRAK
ncbi:Spo0E like sporulation regulatory protein [Schinkia azotoformans MEV2011]|uniref:Spo0E like sporulation regulatory protein n=2 Tax=Schinkia azotoformans TaxID=1454 RepID=K6E5S5_SCHAZ|nr:aspartyl-phosphate phosphatase Spo0E family protein [Schinkia azotoformans]EKN68611.1 hypothetical protein BAZO_03760 [Schinkia azotoformans LMG 9581]KEF37175.1 Spo0E like sporulation regulatory protein [Schinkia azotoformans MEV2011]MEC1637635.1 aspartyl-phosphate phosphatase Spo0E family protein [Schinkia azotoformans]MEC1695451.1 aspartyl-phosphate phosphatase Spo0E family protein [Schinkia azotoformans]MEC1715454.1 aspartyl-phosphate phosphatase Spo0E family protein [Schinkia azotoforma